MPYAKDTSKKCPQCGESPNIIPAGTSKAGKPYAAFLSCPKKQDGSYCGYKWPKEQVTSGHAFNSEMRKMDDMTRDEKKNDTITKLAVIKSVIGSGMKFNEGGKEEVEKWLNFLDGSKPATDADSIPF